MATFETREGDDDETSIIEEKAVIEEDLDIDDIHDSERA